MLTSSVSVRESVAVTVTGDPSCTGFGEAESETVGGGRTIRPSETLSPTGHFEKPMLLHDT